MRRTRFPRPLFAALLMTCALAARAQDYTPDIVEFDGTNSLAFDTAPQLVLADGGTLEFWVAPDWQEDPAYDPVIVSHAGEEGASYLIAMLGGRDGLVVTAGEEEDYFAFDFTDDQLHHVALSHLKDGIVVIVDGEIIGVSDLMTRELPAFGLWVGSINGEDAQFIGAIAGLRVWDEVIARETLVEYALRDIFEDDHPDIDSLSALSDFANGEILLVQAVEPAESP